MNMRTAPAARALLLPAAAGAAAAPYTAFHPGALWLDTDGNRIRAHSAGLLTDGGTTYWYGADGYNSGDGANRVINVYSSTDLYNWKNHGAAFTFNCSEIPSASCYADRPKVLRNPSTRQYVLWLKSTPYVAVATSASPTGPFAFAARWYPNDEHMGDPTAFADPVSGRGWWVYSRKPDSASRVIRLSEMTPDFLNLTGVQSTIAQPLEAPAVFYDAGLQRYYVWTSHCSGWAPNAASVHSAAALGASSWRDDGNPTGNKTTFDSQSTYILPYTTAAGKQRFIYIADRFQKDMKSDPESGRYVWLPIDVATDGSLSVTWRDSWTLDDL